MQVKLPDEIWERIFQLLAMPSEVDYQSRNIETNCLRFLFTCKRFALIGTSFLSKFRHRCGSTRCSLQECHETYDEPTSQNQLGIVSQAPANRNFFSLQLGHLLHNQVACVDMARHPICHHVFHRILDNLFANAPKLGSFSFMDPPKGSRTVMEKLSRFEHITRLNINAPTIATIKCLKALYRLKELSMHNLGVDEFDEVKHFLHNSNAQLEHFSVRCIRSRPYFDYYKQYHGGLLLIIHSEGSGSPRDKFFESGLVLAVSRELIRILPESSRIEVTMNTNKHNERLSCLSEAIEHPATISDGYSCVAEQVSDEFWDLVKTTGVRILISHPSYRVAYVNKEFHGVFLPNPQLITTVGFNVFQVTHADLYSSLKCWNFQLYKAEPTVDFSELRSVVIGNIPDHIRGCSRSSCTLECEAQMHWVRKIMPKVASRFSTHVSSTVERILFSSKFDRQNTMNNLLFQLTIQLASALPGIQTLSIPGEVLAFMFETSIMLDVFGSFPNLKRLCISSPQTEGSLKVLKLCEKDHLPFHPKKKSYFEFLGLLPLFLETVADKCRGLEKISIEESKEDRLSQDNAFENRPACDKSVNYWRMPPKSFCMVCYARVFRSASFAVQYFRRKRRKVDISDLQSTLCEIYSSCERQGKQSFLHDDEPRCSSCMEENVGSLSRVST